MAPSLPQSGAICLPRRPVRTLGAMTKRVLLAKPRGYCAGVDRAVVTVEKALETYGAPVYVRKEIVHNRHVVETLTERGAIFVDEADEVPEGALVVFSAHGVSPAVHEQAAAAAAAHDRRDLPAGDEGPPGGEALRPRRLRHPADRPRGPRGGRGHRRRGAGRTSSWSTAGGRRPRSTVRDPAKVVWLSQTTLSVDETMERVNQLRDALPGAAGPAVDDICYATQNRQVAVKAMAAGVRSGARGRLAELVQLEAAGRGRAAGRREASYLVDYAREVDQAWLDGRRRRSA